MSATVPSTEPPIEPPIEPPTETTDPRFVLRDLIDGHRAAQLRRIAELKACATRRACRTATIARHRSASPAELGRIRGGSVPRSWSGTAPPCSSCCATVTPPPERAQGHPAPAPAVLRWDASRCAAMPEVPSDLKYSKEHEWVRVEDDGLAVVGITDFAQDQLGDVVYLDLPAVGTGVRQFAKMGEIESVKSVSELYAPISGEVVERNEAAIASPEMVNASPYGDGWLIRVRMDNPAELENLLSADEYDALTREAQA
jgi:glycine cleavage system H protein